MIKYYNSYIELKPGYESVVDEHSEERNPNLWQEYIVHEDMKAAVEAICESFRMEDQDKRRSFWIHGSYGTGKSYAAIVLSHLFTDRLENIERFFENKTLLTPYKKKFLSIRKNGEGEFLVIWKKGCPGIHTGVQLMMDMEISIRKALKERFGEKAYYGQNSLVDEAVRIINDEDINWNSLFKSSVYHMSDFGDLDSFRQAVMDGDIKACGSVARICRDKGFAMFASVDHFEEWLKDIISGNNLQDKGIIVIWDEFTDFVKYSGDDIVLQQLSEYCKQQPFFMFLIVHVEPSWLSAMGEKTYERIMHRYHELEFHITPVAAYDMIGDTIIPKEGLEEIWDSKRKELVKSVIGDIDEISFGIKESQIKKLCPIHPVTAMLLTKVSENFAASSRTLFRFMKDPENGNGKVGFSHFINTCGPEEEWSWLTIDYLWDYFFTKSSDIRSMSEEAKRAYQLFENKRGLVENNEYTLRVFKGALLLISVMSTDRTMASTYTKGAYKRLDATRNTLRLCFSGQLTSERVDECLQALHDSGILFLVETSNKKDARLELPYSKNVEKFDILLEQTKKDYSRYILFKKGGEFSKAIEDKLWSKTDATYGRMVISAATLGSKADSLDLRFSELCTELKKFPYKIGVFAIALTNKAEIREAQAKAAEYLKQDDTGRIVCCVLNEPLTEETLDSWYRAKTTFNAASESGHGSGKANAETDMATQRDTWAGAAADGEMIMMFGEKVFPSVYGRGDLMNRVKKNIIKVFFPAAPEFVVQTQTAFRSVNESAVKAGVTLESPKSSQAVYVENSLKNAQLMQYKSIDALAAATGNDVVSAVSQLAGFIKSKMTQGAKIPLDSLWQELQKPPFGYYKNMVSGYLLGFVFRYYKDTDFNWINSDGNPFPLTEKNLVTMILNMCNDKVVNNTLSSGSETWQNFKPYVKSIFDLSDVDVANEAKARHSVSARIISYGVPLWAMKYTDISSIGEKYIEAYNGIIDAFCRFVWKRDEDNQEDIMATIVNLFTGRGKLRSVLMKNFKNKSLRYSAFKSFIVKDNTSMEDLISVLALNDTELFDAIRRLMQSRIDTWTEEQVTEKISDFVLEYTLVHVLNIAMSDNKKQLSEHVVTLNNCFSMMKVPGKVIETINNFEWFDALEKMYYLSVHPWPQINQNDRKSILNAISEFGKDAWQHVQNQKVLLEKYLESKGIAYTQEDVERIYNEAIEWSYETGKPAFEATIEKSVRLIQYEKNRQSLLDRWKKISGFNTVQEWCRNYTVPIHWVVDKNEGKYFTIIHNLCTGMVVNTNDLYNAIQYFKKGDFGFLKDPVFLKNKFLAQVGENRREEFAEYEKDILALLRIKFGSDIYSWSSQGGPIVNTITDFLKEKATDKLQNGVRDKINDMREAELKDRILKAMDEYPELYKFFL